MDENCQTQTETHQAECYDDEIELIDILLVIWKWKYIITAGTLACGLIAAIISFNMAKIYSIDMILRPGLLSIGPEGKNVYIDSSQNIKALIESGAFNNNILNYLNEFKMKNIPKKLEFKVNIPLNSDTIKIEYETADIEQGMAVQNFLKESLLKTYSKLVAFFKNESDMKLSPLQSEINFAKVTILSSKRNAQNIEKRIDELTSEIKLIKNNTTNLIKERNKLLSENPKEKNILSALIYTNTIQQNLQLSLNYQNDINMYKERKENELYNIEGSENEIEKKSNEIKNLQFKKNNIQNIQILQPPTNNPYPIKPRILLIVVLALVAGLFLFIFLSLFLEYLSRYKREI